MSNDQLVVLKAIETGTDIDRSLANVCKQLAEMVLDCRERIRTLEARVDDLQNDLKQHTTSK